VTPPTSDVPAPPSPSRTQRDATQVIPVQRGEQSSVVVQAVGVLGATALQNPLLQ
jgi:hypothetical protein